MYFNGAPATLDMVAVLAACNYGHFTALQARGGRVQGLQRHLDRLQAATQELFGHGLDADRLRGWLREALGDADASVRVSVYSRAFDRDHPLRAAQPDVLIALTPARRVEAAALRVRSVRFARELPHIKHLGSFGLFHQRRLAQAQGFDDALFVTADGFVAEGSTWNILFHDGAQVIWPQAPMLDGISAQLLRAGLAELGVAQASRPVDLSEIPGFRAAFFTNTSCQVMPLMAIDAIDMPIDHDLRGLLERALATQPWQAP